MASFSGELRALASPMTDIRRDLHQHLELGFQEIRTVEMVAQPLHRLRHTMRNDVIGPSNGGRRGSSRFVPT